MHKTMDKKIGIFYGSTLGTTEGVASQIARKLGVSVAVVHNVADVQGDAVTPYDCLLLGSSTWGCGDLQDDWLEYIGKLKQENLGGKYVGLFGCGDSAGYPDSFCDAIGILYDDLSGSGCTFIGAYQPEGYTFDDSKALRDGKFVGLAIDDNNEGNLTEERIDNWVRILREELR